MAKKQKRPPEALGRYDNFVYLLAELELVMAAGTIRWSAATAKATKLRLEELATAMGRVIAQIENE